MMGIEENDVNEFFDIMDDRYYNNINFLEFMTRINLKKFIIYWKIKLKPDYRIILITKLNYYKEFLNQSLEKHNYNKKNK